MGNIKEFLIHAYVKGVPSSIFDIDFTSYDVNDLDYVSDIGYNRCLEDIANLVGVSLFELKGGNTDV